MSTNKLMECLSECLVELEKNVDVSPSILAHACLKKLDPTDVSPALVGWACTLELRQLARGMLRPKESPKIGQEDLFTGLQERYPVAHKNGDDPVYRLREHLSLEDRWFNIERLRREADAKHKHADALQAETDLLEQQGYFKEMQNEL